MTPEERATLAAAVISEARRSWWQYAGQEAAGFDYAISCGDVNAEWFLTSATYTVATPVRGQLSVDECDARANQLADDLASELDAFRARCRAHQYTGWSYASRGPIRYADR